MNIEPFGIDDIPGFLKQATVENWVAEPWEFEFLLSAFPQGCFVVYADGGEPAGFVTSLRHERSGWIGNLIVAADHRGQKIGERLFISALEALRSDGVETVWLTASKSGMPLYQKFGFTRIDTIIRWSGNGRQRLTSQESEESFDSAGSLLSAIDSRAWGDRREALMAVTTGRGKVLLQESGFVVVQQCGEFSQLGPFSASGYSAADALLKAALNTIPSETMICLDAPASNRTALKLFNRNRMRIYGSNELMYVGVKPVYRPELIYGLATMGSCG